MITLTTDFPPQDPYIGAMKGVILRMNPHATIVDIAHGLRRHSVRHAAYVLSAILPYFAHGIHVFVIDPGVGTERLSIAAKIGDSRLGYSWFIGPDNGILTYVAHKVQNVYRIDIEPRSDTFHGRDVFAPAAARMDMGDFDFLEEVDGFHRFPYSPPVKRENSIDGEIIYVDGYGNLVTNIPAEMVKGLKRINFMGKELKIVPSYGFAEKGEIIALINSENYLEIAVNQGSAHKVFMYDIGDKIRVEF